MILSKSSFCSDDSKEKDRFSAKCIELLRTRCCQFKRRRHKRGRTRHVHGAFRTFVSGGRHTKHVEDKRLIVNFVHDCFNALKLRTQDP